MLFIRNRRLRLLLLSKEEAEKEFTYPEEEDQLDLICAARSSRKEQQILQPRAKYFYKIQKLFCK
jgi:hypothetical protein